ncbi:MULTISPECIES: cation transporter [Massilia]|jgi:Co/Zn/Cd efflux system component|uniref:cation transporter n=1 Tax=Massilia TaxID=149698 RepID=UPI000D9E971D|nr:MULTISPECIES: cation transporter [Massilia]QYG03846.1 cation transporter [Massilia sp. NP310]HAK93019.1 cation transporter [Massilia timonae]
MSACCSGSCSPTTPPPDGRYRKVLWAALLINFIMFGVELASSLAAGSVSLLADSVDFLGDAANYGVSLFVLGMAVVWRSRAAYAKGVVMGVFGVLVLARALWLGLDGHLPHAQTMGAVSLLALAANGTVAAMLYAFRNGDANMRSVWLCTRNDMIGNLAVMLAALGVFGARAGWPDIVVASIMACLGLSAARQVMRQARAELRAQAAARSPVATPMPMPVPATLPTPAPASSPVSIVEIRRR